MFFMKKGSHDEKFIKSSPQNHKVKVNERAMRREDVKL
jgi:hypothetical protein